MVEASDEMKARLEATRQQIRRENDPNQVSAMLGMPGVSMSERAELGPVFRVDLTNRRDAQLSQVDRLAQAMGIDSEEEPKK